MLKVGVDCWALRLNGAGARYVFESLLSVIESDTNYKFFLFLHPEGMKCIQELQKDTGILRNTIKITIDNPSEIERYDRFIDIYYCPFNNISFRFFSKPVVSLLHDVQERFMPHLFTPEELEARLEDYDDIVRASTRTITISDFCKDSIIRYCDGTSDKVDVVYNAPQDSLIKHINSEEIKARKVLLGLERRSYIIYPANFYPHKNHRRLLDAYERCVFSGKDMPKLVLIGVAWGNNNDIERAIKEKNLTKYVTTRSHLSSKELAWLYTHCRFVIIPTLFEGFCMPAVEALAFNKLVVCSDLPILREVTDNNALFFDPYDPLEIAQKIIEGLRLENDAQRSTKGCITDRYNWPSAAKKTLAILDRAMEAYYDVGLVERTINSSFAIAITNAFSEQDVIESIQSIADQKYKPSNVDVIILRENHVSLEGASFGLNSAQGINIRISTKEHIDEHIDKCDYYSVFSAGNILSANFFLNTVRVFSETEYQYIIGELHQVHEDRHRTFESSVYFRINHGHNILNGAFYPEMIVSKRDDYIPRIIGNYEKMKDIFRNIITDKGSAFCRHTFAKVRYRTSASLRFTEKRLPPLRYTPTDFRRDLKNTTKERLLANRDFVSYINNKVAADLGCSSTPSITEVDILISQMGHINA